VSKLAGKRILVVEDEPLINMMLEEILLDEGAVVVGPAASLASAMTLAQSEVLDGALLDVNLGDGKSFPVAQLLQQRRVPFVFATAYGQGMDEMLATAPILAKPFDLRSLMDALEQLVGREPR